MPKINFTKMHGLGNDFVLIDKRITNFNLTSLQIKFICNRKLGIGCDQLLIIKNKPNILDNYDYIYQIYNSDGTEVEQCGNGARCCIKYLIENEPNMPQPIRLKSINNVIYGYALKNDLIEIHFEEAKFSPESLLCNLELNLNNRYHLEYECNETKQKIMIDYGIVSVGNPHVVIKLNNIEQLKDTPKLTSIAQFIQKSELFPHGVNVNFYTINFEQKSKNDLNFITHTSIHNIIYLRTYERGCGFTQACGTGAAATVSYAVQQGILSDEVQVNMAGGSLKIKAPLNKEILMSGQATTVFNGTIEL